MTNPEPVGAELGKKTAAAMALDSVESGMALGLGSGSTAEWFVKLLGERIVRDNLAVSCVATSRRTAELAAQCGIAIRPLDDLRRLDLTIDGADEIDPALNLIKGGGGCHLIEKIVAVASDELIIIADDRKLVDTLGAFPLPVEIATLGWETTMAMIAEVVGADVALTRRMADSAPFLTDERNFVIDCPMGTISDPEALSFALNAVPGVVENGLFLGMASRAVIGAADGSARIVTPV